MTHALLSTRNAKCICSTARWWRKKSLRNCFRKRAHDRVATRYPIRAAAAAQEPGVLLHCRAHARTRHRSEHGHLQHGGLAGPAVVTHQGPGADAFSEIHEVRRKFRN